MKDEDWFAYYNETKERFKWFFWAYGYGGEWNKLEELAIKQDKRHMIETMDHVWFMLPDNKFNIMVNPLGWSEFLNLIEE